MIMLIMMMTRVMMRMIMAIRACKLMAPYISFTHII